MQLYDGLPLITNKITPPEACGVPHHLLGHISLDEVPWDVDEFKSQATRIIADIRTRGKLPIIVGGTQYYVDSLLFDDVTLDAVQSASSLHFPILGEPTDVILEELRSVDPAMAERWHPNDRRKIQRSLEIYLTSGRLASELYAEQEQRKAAAAQSDGSWENLLFWVYSEREALCKRLDIRVDKMLEAGLLEEVREVYDLKREKIAQGTLPDCSKGIWQAIGYKQFEPYMVAGDEGKGAGELEELKTKALEDVKTATRRYANYQLRWTRLKQIPRLREQSGSAMDSFYILDSTDVANFEASVVDPAVSLTAKFLRGEERPMPADVSEVSREVLAKISDPPPKMAMRQRTCELCNTTVGTDEAWERHLHSSRHRRVWKKKQRLALVPLDEWSSNQEDTSEHAGSESDAVRGSFFLVDDI